MRKRILISVLVIFILLIGFLIYENTKSNEYIPTNDEIALHIKLDTKEDIGLIVYDYEVDNHLYSGGISNANGSLIKHDSSDNVQVWNKSNFDSNENNITMKITFRIITEYYPPNFENIYPSNITKYIEPLEINMNYGNSYYVTISGNKTNGYTAALN